jgi:hypothetical protein
MYVAAYLFNKRGVLATPKPQLISTMRNFCKQYNITIKEEQRLAEQSLSNKFSAQTIRQGLMNWDASIF